MSLTIDEFLDQLLQEDLKNLNNSHRSMMNAVRRVKTSVAEGNLDALQQALSRYEELVEKQGENLQGVKEKLPAFDLQAYLHEGFHEGFLAALNEEGLAVDAQYPVYEVLPFKVRVLPDKDMITVDDKVYRNLRPRILARHLSKAIDRLNSASFDAQRFLQVLAAAYDTVMARQIARTGIEISEQEVMLNDVYQTLTPMPQQKRDYPLQLFAFDLHRVLRGDRVNAPDGRRMWLGNVRNQKQAMVVLDAQGQPQRYGVMKFYREV